jgi:hypothetical protein
MASYALYSIPPASTSAASTLLSPLARTRLSTATPIQNASISSAVPLEAREEAEEDRIEAEAGTDDPRVVRAELLRRKIAGLDDGIGHQTEQGLKALEEARESLKQLKPKSNKKMSAAERLAAGLRDDLRLMPLTVRAEVERGGPGSDARIASADLEATLQQLNRPITVQDVLDSTNGVPSADEDEVASMPDDEVSRAIAEMEKEKAQNQQNQAQAAPKKPANKFLRSETDAQWEKDKTAESKIRAGARRTSRVQPTAVDDQVASALLAGLKDEETNGKGF